jgi:hypothetical protein
MTLSKRSNETVKLPAQDLGQVWPRDPDQICGCCLGQRLGLDQLGETEHQARLDLLVSGVADADVGKDIFGASRDAFYGITEGLLVVFLIGHSPLVPQWIFCGFRLIRVAYPRASWGSGSVRDLKSTMRWLRLLGSLTRYDLTAFNTQSVTIGL